MFRSPRAEEYIELIQGRLKSKTVRHSISSATLMVSLADTLPFTEEQAEAAGLLHDVGKVAKKSDLVEQAELYGISVTPVHRARPKLLHGPVGAEFCRRELRLSDDTVYDAIYWHTTGRPGFGPLGLALYFADYAEPLRTHEQADHARALLDAEGFLAALRYVADEKLAYVRNKPPVDPATEAFWTWLNVMDLAV